MASKFDTKFMKIAVSQARESKHHDGRIHPHVGVVVTRDGKEIDRACHGEKSSELDPAHCDHAEYIVLQKKLPHEKLSGCTVYTTLEPCTYRNPPKTPCVDRLIERHVRRVVIGMLDPNQMITGKGVMKLRQANIAVDLFPPRLMAELEELNRDFIRQQTAAARLAYVPCHGTKYHVPDSGQFWNDLLEYARQEFILVGNSNKSWFRRDETQSRALGIAIGRIITNGGRVVIISGTDVATVSSTNAFINTHVAKPLGKGPVARQAIRERLVYAQAERVNYSAVLSDDRLLIMPRLNSQEFAAEAMVLELSRTLHASQFKHYKDDINRVVADFAKYSITK